MTDDLFVGVSKRIELNNFIEDARQRLQTLTSASSLEEVIAYKIQDGIETHVNGASFGPGDYFQLRLSRIEHCVGLTQFETENIPGYATIEEPFTVGISAGTYSPIHCRIFAACVAASIASCANSAVQDLNHYWSQIDLSSPQDFMKSVKRKYLESK